jgi:ASC-1-like (ASCH) protein
MGDKLMAKKKNLLKKIIDTLGYKSAKELEQERTIKKLELEVLALKQMIHVYEQAILNEREVATNALKSLSTLK